MEVLKVDNLSKNYGAIKALNGVSFSVPAGSIFGILGPNGSGKTTLLGIVMDVLKATSGNFLWNGEPGTNEHRKKIGTLLETPNFYHYLSAQKNLEITAEIKGRDKADIARVLQLVNLTQRKHSKFSTYSLGMKQRLAIANALLGNPDILVFDEPTNGLDPAGIAEIRELMKKLSLEGKTIIMASHILDEVEKVCTHVAIIQKGDLKTVGSVQEVLNTTNNNVAVDTIEFEIAADDYNKMLQLINGLKGITAINDKGNMVVLTSYKENSAANMNKYFMENGVVLTHLVLKKKSLESRFLEITGNVSDR
jgi:ABC-type multidrug transport system ATPase subunit